MLKKEEFRTGFQNPFFQFNKTTVETKKVPFLYLRVALSTPNTSIVRKRPWLCIIIVFWRYLKKHFKCFHHCQKYFFIISKQSLWDLETWNYVMACFALIEPNSLCSKTEWLWSNILFSASLQLSPKSWPGIFWESASW